MRNGHLNVVKALTCADSQCIQMKINGGMDVVKVATENKQGHIVDFLQRFQSGTSSSIFYNLWRYFLMFKVGVFFQHN